MPGVYKQYVFSDTPMSRTTRWRRRKALQRNINLVTVNLVSHSDQVVNVSSQRTDNTTHAVDHSTLNVVTPNSDQLVDVPSQRTDNTYHAVDHSAPTITSLESECPEGKCVNGLITPPTAHEREENMHLTTEDDNARVTDLDFEERSHETPTEDNLSSTRSKQTSADTRSNFHDAETSKSLCSCTECTAGDVITMCLALGIRHNLTWQAQVDILKMINAIYGRTVISSSKYTYFKEVHDHKDSMEFHVFCNQCALYLGERAGSKGCMLCEVCEKDVEVSDPLNYFVLLPLEPQLSNIFQDSYLVNLMLTWRSNRVKENNDALEDIYDGREYRKLSTHGGILSSIHNFSYNFFTDGCPYGKASGKTIWPIYILLNELPPKERSQYMCLVGLYVGPRDPDLGQYLKPFVAHANKLSTIGFAWEHKGETIVSKFIPLCAVADSVARCALLNRQSFNGYYGCTYCYHKTTSTRRGSRFVISENFYPDRTRNLLYRDITEASSVWDHPDASKRHYKGVKGPTPLMDLYYFNVISGAPVDYMHNICLGAIRTHMSLLFNHHDKRKFWVGMENHRIGQAHLETAIDEHLLKMQPHSFVPRTPRSIVKRKLWKANEWLAWLLFYSIPCLINILDEKYVIHIALLSKATFLLLKNSITTHEINEAHNLLLSYMYLFQNYFGESEMVYNIHLLSHVCEGVQNWGPLWTHNAFVFEGQNRFLMQLCKGPHLLALQMAQRFLIFNSFPSTSSRLLTAEAAANFCTSLLHKRAKIFLRCGDAVLLGAGKICNNLSDEEVNALKESGIVSGNCLLYKRMIYKNVRYICEDYYEEKKLKQNDAYLYTTDEKVVILKRILQVSGVCVRLCVEDVVCGKEILECCHPLSRYDRFSVDYLREGTKTSSIKWIAPNQIMGPCMSISTLYGNYVCPVPIGVHTD